MTKTQAFTAISITKDEIAANLNGLAMIDSDEILANDPRLTDAFCEAFAKEYGELVGVGAEDVADSEGWITFIESALATLEQSSPATYRLDAPAAPRQIELNKTIRLDDLQACGFANQASWLVTEARNHPNAKTATIYADGTEYFILYTINDDSPFDDHQGDLVQTLIEEIGLGDEHGIDPIDRLEAMPIVGNAHDDKEIFAAVHAIVSDPNEPMAHKIRPLRKSDQTMGEHPDHPVTGKSVEEYLAFWRAEEEAEQIRRHQG